jgi:hypothetical protein
MYRCGASKQPESTDKKMTKSAWLNIDRTFGNFRRFSLSPKGWEVQIARKPVFIDRNRIFTSLSVDSGKQLAPHHIKVLVQRSTSNRGSLI